ncbi:hypothetical protein vseg_000118 [Gypsophila vaccaria]
MLLRNSISNTKKFFQKTINNFKSFLSKGTTYEKLPKTPNIEELDNFYVEFTHHWDAHTGKQKNDTPLKKSKKLHQPEPSSKQNPTQGQQTPRKVVLGGETEVNEGLKSTKTCVNVVRGFRPSELLESRSVREKKVDMFAQKLKELEMIDKGNIVHKMDVEEILHYYSRLTCPFYVEIVDKFFNEICIEFVSTHQVSSQVKIV